MWFQLKWRCRLKIAEVYWKTLFHDNLYEALYIKIELSWPIIRSILLDSITNVVYPTYYVLCLFSFLEIFLTPLCLRFSCTLDFAQFIEFYKCKLKSMKRWNKNARRVFLKIRGINCHEHVLNSRCMFTWNYFGNSSTIFQHLWLNFIKLRARFERIPSARYLEFR